MILVHLWLLLNNRLLYIAGDYLKWYNILRSRTYDMAICKFNLHILYGRLCLYISMIGSNMLGFQKVYDWSPTWVIPGVNLISLRCFGR